MNFRFVIGISGKMKAGKDLTAALIRNLLYNDRVQQEEVDLFAFLKWDQGLQDNYALTKSIAFADTLKKVASDITGEGITTFYDEFAKMEHMRKPFDLFTRRQFLTTLGDKLQEIDRNIFLKSMEAKMKEEDRVIVTDVRFENEAEFIKEKKGILIRLERPLKNRHGYDAIEDIRDSKLLEKLMHRSETSLDNHNFKHTISWEDDLRELYIKVGEVLSSEGIINGKK